MHSASSIRKVENVYVGKKIELPGEAGIIGIFGVRNNRE